MVNAHCPIGKWQQQWTIVVANPLRQQVRAACRLSSMFAMGTIPSWYIGKTIPSPPRNNSSQVLCWLQKVIDEPNVTENFLWVEDALPLMPFQDLRIPRASTSPINPINETLLGPSPINFETPWPFVFNKGKLQEVLDHYRPPYHMGTIYFNHFPTTYTRETPPPREELPYCDLELF